MHLTITNCPNQALALTNRVFVSPADLATFDTPKEADQFLHVKLFSHIYPLESHESIPSGSIGLNSLQRKSLQLSSGDGVDVQPYLPTPPEEIQMVGSISQLCLPIQTIQLEIDTLSRSKAKAADTIDATNLCEAFKRKNMHGILSISQPYLIEFCGTNYVIQPTEMHCLMWEERSMETDEVPLHGLTTPHTTFGVRKASGTNLKLTNVPATTMGQSHLLGPSFNFESMGIGGLDREFVQIFRRAFASRIYPPSFVASLGIAHVKGMLLYGPPGTGKTLIARQIGKILNAREPKIVNGPEILNKYVGQSEENIRNLFKDAEEDMLANGDDSDLHIIIFDELDAICKQRGSSGDSTGVHDTVVNQLLSKIDGVEALNNILVIGMTNRKDLIDSALLRPGRLEVHVEISLPDEPGRVQIFAVHTKKLTESKCLDDDVSLEALAARSKNYSGAEIEGVVKAAASYAFHRSMESPEGDEPIHPSLSNLSSFKVSMQDFMMGLEEIQPAFGVASEDLVSHLRGGLLNYGPIMEHLLATTQRFVSHVATNDQASLVSVLLEGPTGSGKTALACHLATQGDGNQFPFVKFVSAESFVGLLEQSKVRQLQKVFDDAMKSPISLIILDNLERLVEYVRIGPRFSNLMLQSLLVLVNRVPPPGHRLLIMATTSAPHVLESLELADVFNARISIPNLKEEDSIASILTSIQLFEDNSLANQAARLMYERHCMQVTDEGIGIKKLLLVCELARQHASQRGSQAVSLEDFQACLADLNL